MENHVTNHSNTIDDRTVNQRPSATSLPMVIGAVLLITILPAVNLLFIRADWLQALIQLALVSGSILLVGALIARKRMARSAISTSPRPAGTASGDPASTEIAKHTSWTALRPQLNGESRNCKVSNRSTDTRLFIEPIQTLQYTSLITAIALTVCLLSLIASGCLPQLPFIATQAQLEPTTKAFVYFFGCSALVYVAFLLRKPLRALVFDKQAGVFWIEKHRVFNWKVGESAQMPIAQVHALQILTYSSRRNCPQDKDQMATTQPAGSEPTVIHYSSLKEYEVNVVFRNGERVNIMNHRNARAITQDADTLAEFLGIPVWLGIPVSDNNHQ